jgi:hypothetical protein
VDRTGDLPGVCQRGVLVALRSCGGRVARHLHQRGKGGAVLGGSRQCGVAKVVGPMWGSASHTDINGGQDELAPGSPGWWIAWTPAGLTFVTWTW